MLSKEEKGELYWLIQNLHLCNGRYLINPPPQLVIASDASLQGWGAFGKNGGSLVLSGVEIPHKHSRVEGSKTCDFIISSNVSRSIVDTYSDGQYCSSILSKKDGRDSKSKINVNKQGNLGLSTGSSDHNYGRIPTRRIECGGRYNVSECKGSKRVEVRPTCVSTLVSGKVHSFASRLTHQVPLYYAWKLDPYSRDKMHYKHVGLIYEAMLSHHFL